MGEPWNFIAQMKGILAVKNDLTLAELKLLLTIFEVNNEQHRRETFQIENAKLAKLAGMRHSNMLRVRHSLIEKGYITTEPGKKGGSNVYRMRVLYATKKGQGYPDDTENEEKGYPHDTLNNPHDTENNPDDYKTKKINNPDDYKNNPHDTLNNPHDTLNNPHDYKKVSEPLKDKACESPKRFLKGIKKDSKRGKRKSQTFTPPTLEEVRAYVKERNSPVDPVRFYEYFTAGDWYDSRGNKVKSWKQKLLTWEAKSDGKQAVTKGPVMTQEEMEALRERVEREQEERARLEAERWKQRGTN